MKMSTLLSLLSAAFGASRAPAANTKPTVYCAHCGDGWAAKVMVLDGTLDRLVVRLEKKIGLSDVSGGRLIPAAKEVVKRRGGKSLLGVPMSYESAEMLYKALGHALKDVRKRRYQRECDEELELMMSHVMSHFGDMEAPQK